MKAYETPEEKRARRLAKKEMKERKRKAAMGWDTETLVKEVISNSSCWSCPPTGYSQLLLVFSS